jgi:hypothetical protein
MQTSSASAWRIASVRSILAIRAGHSCM